MKKIWIILVILIVGIQTAAVCADRVYDNEKRLSIEVAEGWNAVDSPQKPICLMLTSTSESGANVNIIPEENANISLEDYEKLNESNSAKDPDLIDFTIITRTDTQIDGVAAKSWVYSAKVGKDKTPIKCKVTFVIKNNTAFVITCGASEQKFESQLEAFDSMVSSIHWNKAPPAKKPAPVGKPVRISDKNKVISVLMPAGWKSDPNPQGALLVMTGPPPTSSVSVLTEKVGAMTLAGYEKASEKNATGGTDAFTIVSKSPATIGKVAAKKWVYTATYGEKKIPLKCMVFLVVRNKVAYTITMGSVDSQFDKAQPVFSSCAKSIIWLK